MAKNPETTWKMLNVAFENYQNHIQRKDDKFNLDIFDFLHISNFKGGNASITEPEKMINIKAKKYSEILTLINKQFADKSLGDLSKDELEKLKKLCLTFVGLPLKKETDIRGVASSYASAILAAYFPKLIPILDRRVINGAGIKAEKDSQGQIKNIQNYYAEVIDCFYKELSSNKSLQLRELDKKWFIVPI